MSAYRDWLVSRKKGVGSSDAPVVYLGRVFKRTTMDLYIEKRKPVPDHVTDDHDNPDFRRGHAYEPVGIAMFEHETGIQVAAPATDEERYKTFQRFHPELPAYADFDGLTVDPADAWVVEVKSPRQMTCDRIHAEGPADYYLVQCAHLAEVAFASGTHLWPAGVCKGTILIIYEPENVSINVIRVPRDPEFGAAVLDACKTFWQHVETSEPPFQAPPRAVSRQGTGDGKYTKIKDLDEAAKTALDRFLLTRETKAMAIRRHEESIARVKAWLDDLGEAKVVFPNGVKFSYVEQAGRTSLDINLLKAEHPEIDFTRYDRQGEPFEVFNCYGIKDRPGSEADNLDEHLSGIAAELDAFAEGAIDFEESLDLFDDLRARSEMFTRMLQSELGSINAKLQRAGEALSKSMLGGGTNDQEK